MVASAHRACDDGLPSRFDGGPPPRERSHNYFLPCPYYGKQNPANKHCKQFSKPHTAQAVVTPSVTLYHGTLTSIEYDELHCSGSTKLFFS